jgi:soluble lytic murein transglycosylase
MAELALGRPDYARDLLRPTVESTEVVDPVTLAVLGSAEFGTGNYERAGELFALVADAADGVDRGIFSARAAVALDLAGMRLEATRYYRRAAVLLPQISGWLAIREARGTEETIRALSLLRKATPEAGRPASEARGAVYLAAGDTTRALAAFSTAGNWAVATELAFSMGDTATGRLHAFRALESGDTSTVRVGLVHALGSLARPIGRDAYVMASAHRRLGELDDAIDLLESLVEAGDTSAATLRRLGDLLSSRGRRQEALQFFERTVAASVDSSTGGEAALAEYRRARLLIQTGRASDGYRALEAFADRHERHTSAPYALYLVADWHRRGRRTGVADSVLALVATRWPRSTYGGRARMTLATSALARRDTAEALEWYVTESQSSTADRRAAQYFHADLLNRTGDSVAADLEWRRLAREDSLGYYGLAARRTLGLDDPTYAPAGQYLKNEGMARTLERLDVLQLAYLHDEAAEVLRYQLARDDLTGDEMLALAEGLIERGWMQEAVNLGWRVAEERTLNDPRVLRVIFPWPLRSLIEQEAAEHRVDPYLLAGLIRQESNFRPAVISRAGARGLMQLMPSTASWLARQKGIPWDRRYLTTAELNLHLGTAHLAALLRTYDGDVIPALAAYNAGGRPVARWLRYPEAGDPIRFVERIPYVETRGYLRTVLRNQSLYRGLYPPVPSSEGTQ